MLKANFHIDSKYADSSLKKKYKWNLQNTFIICKKVLNDKSQFEVKV